MLSSKFCSLLAELYLQFQLNGSYLFLFFTIEYHPSPPHVFPLSCVQEMTRGNRYKTIRWRFVESLEPSRVVHARCPDMVTKGNLYGQVTVRMHSKQVRFDLALFPQSVKT